MSILKKCDNVHDLQIQHNNRMGARETDMFSRYICRKPRIP